ncbi:MAG: hypothetical protein A2020_06185 [Lentisphaerae bacterium GWF2_45_14]|nr:MAG: hypothetical protein A2020_06185 [Lentisphaerae bacterium GWF2_45_14]
MKLSGTKSLALAFCVVTALAFTSSAQEEDGAKFKDRPMKAAFASKPVVVDGKLDDEVWKNAIVYDMSLPVDTSSSSLPEYLNKKRDKTVKEGAKVRIAWDKDFIYISAEMTDSDLYCYGEGDQQHYYKAGDVLEVFLKPENNDNETWYWELYAAPNGKKTALFFPGAGCKIFPEADLHPIEEQKTGAVCEGTVNVWEDKDKGWTAEMAVPIKALTSRGEKFGPGSKWKILVSRYNYNRYFPSQELSSFPQLSKGNYHLCEEYALIEFEPDFIK